jgi:hypothetical protein
MSRNPGRIFRIFFPLILFLWILLVFYPNPINLIISIQRGIYPGIDPAAVETLTEDIPCDPAAVELTVLQQIVPYSYDWEVHSMPWYVPTVEDVLENGRGDCKARALVLASILEAKGIPYQLNWSPIHVWVNYEGKEGNSLENPDVQFYQHDPETGERSFKLPSIPFSTVWSSFWQGFWSPMPGIRKALLISGPVVLIAIYIILFKKSRRHKQERAIFLCHHSNIEFKPCDIKTSICFIGRTILFHIVN